VLVQHREKLCSDGDVTHSRRRFRRAEPLLERKQSVGALQASAHTDYTPREIDVAMAKRKDLALAQSGKPRQSDDCTPRRRCRFQKPNQLEPGVAVDPTRSGKQRPDADRRIRAGHRTILDGSAKDQSQDGDNAIDGARCQLIGNE
jgi:hypothetical protein